jgi:hypothetical protein
MTHEELAEKAYAAYCSSMGNIEQNGQRCAPWQSLAPVHKAAWMAATHAIVANANGRDLAAERELELAGKLPVAAAAEKKRQEADEGNGHKKAKAHSHSAR